jgi:hypothetical protein
MMGGGKRPLAVAGHAVFQMAFGRRVTMKQFRAAVVGCGRIGSTIDDEIDRWSSTMLPYSHAARYAEAHETELVAGCDVDPAKAEAFRQRWGLDRAFTDIDEMMEVTQPEIVSIGTETAARTEAGLKAAAHDLEALFIDKPVAETLRDADRLLDACRDRGIVVAVNCSRVWDPRAIPGNPRQRDARGGDDRRAAVRGGLLSGRAVAHGQPLADLHAVLRWGRAVGGGANRATAGG